MSLCYNNRYFCICNYNNNYITTIIICDVYYFVLMLYLYNKLKTKYILFLFITFHSTA